MSMKLLLRYRLFEKYTIEQLCELSKTETNSKKQDEISQAINLHIIEKKKKQGTYIAADGYSGRKSKK